MPKVISGYTLPVFACASAIAALRHLRQDLGIQYVNVNLLEPPEIVKIAIEQVAKLDEKKALGITRSAPGDNLDLTRHTPIWALVELKKGPSQIVIEGGEGVGKQLNQDGKAAIYNYAEKLLQTNLKPFLKPDETIWIKIILPEGKALAKRTSNEAFGVVEGLSLLGTTGISQPLSSPQQLANFQAELTEKAQKFECLVFCIGENGLDLARQQGINSEQLIKTANWLGPLLIAAALTEIPKLLLFGYHGKLIKLAGGIFHTHHHLADARLEILTAQAAKNGLPIPYLQQLLICETTEIALIKLRQWEQELNQNLVSKIYQSIAETIDFRSQRYIYEHTAKSVEIGSVLFDRDRKILIHSQRGEKLIKQLLSETISN